MPSPIAREIKNASGFSTMDEVRSAMPDDPDAIDHEAPKASKGGKKKPPKSVKGSQPQAISDPFANDVRYQKACSRMSAFGGKGLIIKSFDAGSRVLDDEEFKLDSDEKETWDDFFYVLSKKAMFDVGHPVFLFLFFIITLCAQLGYRLMERTEAGQFVKELFTMKKDEEPKAPEGDK
jgi:hypothetical protein